MKMCTLVYYLVDYYFAILYNHPIYCIRKELYFVLGEKSNTVTNLEKYKLHSHSPTSLVDFKSEELIHFPIQ